MSDDGIRYEQFCCRYLQDRGFKTSTTPASGDQGVDIIATKDDVRYAIQCKYRTDSDVGNDAIQQVSAGKGFYDCDVAVVMTNSGFTPRAKELARKLRVRLWENIHLSKDLTGAKVANESVNGVNFIIKKVNSKSKVSNDSVNEVNPSIEAINKLNSELHSYKLELDNIQSELNENNELQPISITVETPDNDDELEYILYALEKCGISAHLKRALSCGIDHRYYFQSLDVYDDILKLYELQKVLLSEETDEMMIIDRVSSTLFVVIVPEPGFFFQYAYRNEILYKWKSMIIGRNLQDNLINMEVDARYLFSARTKDEDINEHIFIINGQFPSEEAIETELMQLYPHRIRVISESRYLRVFISDVGRLNEEFNLDKLTLIEERHISPMDGKLTAFIDTSIDNELTDVRIVLESVSTDDLLDVDSFTFKNPSNVPLWRNIICYLHVVFELILSRTTELGQFEMCQEYRLRVLDCTGHTMFILFYGIVNRRFDYSYEADSCYDLFLINDMFGWDNSLGLGPFKSKFLRDIYDIISPEGFYDNCYEKISDQVDAYDLMLIEKDDYIQSLFERFNNTNNKPPVKLSYDNNNGKVTINYTVSDDTDV